MRARTWSMAVVPRRVRRVALFAAALSCSPSMQSVSGPRVLVFSRTAAFRHASIEPGVNALQARARAEGIGMDATEDEGAFTSDNLARYDAVVFLSTTGDVLGPSEQGALERFVRGGGGFVGIHSASDTEYDWPWYGALVGAYFQSHPPGVHSATLVVADASHAATHTLPTPWVRTDEWYDFRDVQPGLSVLLEIDESSYKTPAESPAPAPRPIAWYRDFDGGRSFYTALGHTEESWSESLFLDHVWGGITWTMGL
jgi:type 1 glutamine amidotransferase